jgi:hypothetical protein
MRKIIGRDDVIEIMENNALDSEQLNSFYNSGNLHVKYADFFPNTLEPRSNHFTDIVKGFEGEYILDLKSTYEILAKRVRCMSINPQYALNKAIQLFNTRLTTLMTYYPNLAYSFVLSNAYALNIEIDQSILENTSKYYTGHGNFGFFTNQETLNKARTHNLIEGAEGSKWFIADDRPFITDPANAKLIVADQYNIITRISNEINKRIYPEII